MSAKPRRTFFHSRAREDGVVLTAEYSIEDGTACIWEAWEEPSGRDVALETEERGTWESRIYEQHRDEPWDDFD